MTTIRISSVFVAMGTFALGAILGLAFPTEWSTMWLVLVIFVLALLWFSGRFWKSRKGSLSSLEILSHLFTTFVGGFVTAQLAAAMDTAKRDGAEGFFEIAGHMLTTNSQGLFFAVGLALYGVAVILQTAIIGFVDSRRPER